MYHNAVGPAAATGLGLAGAGGFTALLFSPLGMMWIILGLFAIIAAFAALWRAMPTPVARGSRHMMIRAQRNFWRPRK